LSVESQHAIVLLGKISEILKEQHRHFDDAVVTHCIRLIHDYVQDNLQGSSTEPSGLVGK